MAEVWPPARTAHDRWERKIVRVPHGPRRYDQVRCRRVPLWGRLVWLHDESGRVWCPCCWALVDVAELGRVDNRHPVGLPPRTEGRLLPMGDDPQRSSAERWDLDDA